MGDGNVLEPLCLLGLIGPVTSSSLISSTGSLLGAGVMLWVDPLEDKVVAVFRVKLLIGNEEPLIFGVTLTFGSSGFFLKKPAMDVWFLELEFDLISEGVGVSRVLFEDLEEGAIFPRYNSSYRYVRLFVDELNAGRGSIGQDPGIMRNSL